MIAVLPKIIKLLLFVFTFQNLADVHFSQGIYIRMSLADQWSYYLLQQEWTSATPDCSIHVFGPFRKAKKLDILDGWSVLTVFTSRYRFLSVIKLLADLSHDILSINTL